MILSDDEHVVDVICPRCGAFLLVDDPEDFESRSPMMRQEEFYSVCPKCGGDFAFRVQWEPEINPYARRV